MRLLGTRRGKRMLQHRVVDMALVSITVALVLVIALGSLLPRAGMPGPAHAQSPQTLKYTGAASCGASNCHGATKPKPDYPRLNENILWMQKDKHAKAFATLTNEKLKSGVRPSKIVKELKIANAEASDRCLICHAVNVPAPLRASKFDITEGVHCDGCHGPAEKWLEPHAEKGWTHEQSVKVGMYDTKNFLLRAEKCVACHLKIDQELVAAGHPDLVAFELDTFSANMPPHWRDKGTWIGTKTWATGQVIALREAAKQLGERAKANASPTLLEDALKKVRGHGAMVRHFLDITAPEQSKALQQDVAAVTEAVGKDDKGGIGSASGKIVAATQQLAPAAASREYDLAIAQKLIQAIAGDGEGIGGTGIRAAEQGAMALDRLYNTYSKSPGHKADKAASDALDKVFNDIQDPSKYDGKRFAADVKEFLANFK